MCYISINLVFQPAEIDETNSYNLAIIIGTNYTHKSVLL